ncbi:unnamed protein product [Musa acuminata subsp. malaccensis]|uniref:(wild Malaysian banana) hypothetical protein n=1 Tax=Musa acuminata subsp. malaccensis TaxID=214687 RepID=A0A804K6U7_MUSAM|nr:unnamed protein product [Musa acuminata subsp. malaccensis]
MRKKERDQSVESTATTAPHMPSIKPDSATSTTDPSFVPVSLFPWASTHTSSISLLLLHQNVRGRSTYVIDGGRGHGQLHRYPPGHHPPSTGCLPQVRMPGGVLDLPAVDVVRVPPGHHLCCVCHHQVNSFLLLQGF